MSKYKCKKHELNLNYKHVMYDIDFDNFIN